MCLCFVVCFPKQLLVRDSPALAMFQNVHVLEAFSEGSAARSTILRICVVQELSVRAPMVLAHFQCPSLFVCFLARAPPALALFQDCIFLRGFGVGATRGTCIL